MEHAWIASRDEEVQAVLTSPAFNVRPAGELVPKAMLGTPLEPIFERLVRMNDGERHAHLRGRVEQRLSRWNLEEVRRIAAQAATRVAPQDIAGYTVATLIGLRDPQRALPWIRDFAAAIAAGAPDEAIARGAAAVGPLLDALPASDDPDEAANALGFLFQSYAATARLIEITQAGRTDAPVTLTRRYAIEDTVVCGTPIPKGATVVVLLTSPKFHFGDGRHACPGQRIAEAIANAIATPAASSSSGAY